MKLKQSIMYSLKLFLSTILFLSLFSTSSAQVWSIKLGASFPQLVSKSTFSPDFDHKTPSVNIHGGVSVDFKINKLISIEPSLILFRKKMNYETPNLLSEYRITYLNIPVPVRFNFHKEEKTFFGFAGGYLDYGMNGETLRNKIYRNDVWPKSKEERRLKRLDVGVTYGIGFVFSTLQIELFSNLGFVNIAKEFDDLTTARNRNFGCSVSLKFGKHGTDFD